MAGGHELACAVEIGDICNDLFTNLPTGETVQLEWSNHDNTCKL